MIVASLISNGTSNVSFYPLWRATAEVLCQIYDNARFDWVRDVPMANQDTFESFMSDQEKRAIHMCALGTQSVCLGLLSYSSAHVGKVQPFFLNRPLRKVNLLGIDTAPANELRFSVEQVKLTCVGDMPSDQGIAWRLNKGVSYGIGKPATNLTAKVIDTNLDMRLSVTQSKIPKTIWNRMKVAQKVGTLPQRIQERHDVDMTGTQVLILTEN